MELLWVALLVAGFIAFVVVDTWYYRVYRPRRAYQKAYEEGVASARRDIQRDAWRQALEGMSVEQVEDLLARVRAEQRRRAEEN